MPDLIWLFVAAVALYSAYDKGTRVGRRRERERIEGELHPLENMTRSYACKRHPVIQAAIYERVTDVTVLRRCDILEDETPDHYEALLNE
jgi:hypothetical protein